MAAASLPSARCLRRIVDVAPEQEWWAELPALNLRQAVTGAVPQQTTAVQLAWDDAELHVHFDIQDTHVWAILTERDAPLYREEVVEVFLDPVGDLECYFEIEVNPRNAVLDLVLRKNRSGYGQDVAWDCEGLRTVVRRHAQGWGAELAIPFRSLAADPPQAGTRWRGNFCRIDRPPGVERELSAWSPPHRGTFHTPERFGWIEFVGRSA